MEANQVLTQLKQGKTTPSEIANGEKDQEEVLLVLNTLEELGKVKRTHSALTNGTNEPQYELVTNEIDQTVQPVEESDGVADKLPVNRDYDWDDAVPSTEEVPEYTEKDNEITKVKAELKRRKKKFAREPIMWFTGPVGCGKTVAARRIAAELDAAFFTIQGKYSMSSASILGSPMMVGEGTIWSDGPATKAVLASKDRPTVLFIDEGNRARPEAKESLYSLFDDRSSVVLEKRGGEVIKGDPDNLIIIVTTNEGEDNITQDLDVAEIRRYGNKHAFDYLGYISDEDVRGMGDHSEKPENFEDAAELIAERSGAPIEFSKELVAIANKVRAIARGENYNDNSNGNTRYDSAITSGIPTSSLIKWAQTANSYWEEDIENPVVEAGKDSILKFYDDDDRAETRVEQLITSGLQNAPIGEESFKNWAENDMNEFVDDE